MSTATLSYSGAITEAKPSPKVAAPQAAASGKGLFARFYDALIEARMRQAMRELALHRHLLPENSITIER